MLFGGIQSFFLAGRYPRVTEVRAVLEALGGRVLTDASTEVKATPDDLKESIASAPAGPAGSTKPLVTALTIAADSGVGRRRTQVILRLLREAGVIRRGRRGYELKAKEVPRDAAIKELLQKYVDRGARDKERLAEMMHYAETPACRMQVIRGYFGEAEGEPCMRCDNCARAAEAGVEHPAAAQLLGGAGRQEEEMPVREETPQVTVIETMHGTIQTTAPETLVQPGAPAAFGAGEWVRHRKFGLGKVLDAHNGNVLVRFERAGEKRIVEAFLRAA